MAQLYREIKLSADKSARNPTVLWAGEEKEKAQLEFLGFPDEPIPEQRIIFYGKISAGAITGRPFFLSAIEPIVTEPSYVIEYVIELLQNELSTTEGIASCWYSWDGQEQILRLYTFTSELDYDLETLIYTYYSSIVETHEETDFELRVIPLNNEREDSLLPPNSSLIFSNK
jgi:hypothetical protein